MPPNYTRLTFATLLSTTRATAILSTTKTKNNCCILQYNMVYYYCKGRPPKGEKDMKKIEKMTYAQASAYLKELKQQAIQRAVEKTLDFFKENLGNSYTYFCRVVGKEIPKKDNYPYSYRLLLSNLHKSKISFEAKSQILEENI